ncbi:Homeobox protein HD-5 [Nosema granulosis]|uniref:Homeobox protein HD-5 n=1 Tax=Nosema granulosis TaxID=83296 RepID=A0A9P6H196_9MICR|nr:Homeobox protein HD-5 [Nosema granulosis]
MPIDRRVKFIDSTSDIHKYFNSPSDPKRSRLKLSSEQISILESNFKIDSHPSHMTKNFLSNKLNIPLRNIQIWFQNRRAKDKTYRENDFNSHRFGNMNLFSKFHDNYFY